MGRRQPVLEEAVALLASQGATAILCVGDVRKPHDCQAAVDRTIAEFGELNVLVNGAAGMFPASLGESMSPNGFKTVLEIDVLGTYNMCYSAFEALKRCSKAIVVNITVPRHYADGRNWWVGHMQSAKAAITTMSHAMAKEWAEFGIRVTNIAPGCIADTPAQLKTGSREGITATASKLSAEGIPVAPFVPLGRMGTSYECAMAVLFLCVSEYITAETIAVDGGWWLGNQTAVPSRETLNAITRRNEAKSRGLVPSKL
eukprot:TRINITY_DN14085_c0_g1_i5.p1 TRINITY_DN14085_c0_g1~~TRINITY_DN14085_c0_g1_i5.p1  ORF type:complete len:258 (+),score=58.55 TRINITY_DN14085_c0_g1_i5:136-909(+)